VKPKKRAGHESPGPCNRGREGTKMFPGFLNENYGNLDITQSRSSVDAGNSSAFIVRKKIFISNTEIGLVNMSTQDIHLFI
jgi:hypothetical protein